MRRRAASSPPDELAELYADQYERVRGALVAFTGDRRLAEELAQEAFMKTCQHWEKVRVMDAPGAWVHRVGINLAISRSRRGQTERRLARRLRAEASTRPAAVDVEPADEALAAALASLPTDERAVVVLRFGADLSVAEVARALGIPEGTVKTRTRRALASLRVSGLAQSVEGDGDGDRDELDEVTR